MSLSAGQIFDLRIEPLARVDFGPFGDLIEVPLVAGAAVRRLGLIGRLGAAVNYLLWGGSR